MKALTIVGVTAVAAAAFSAYLPPAMLVGFAYLRFLCG